jgi:hypothetical protein
MHGHRQPWSCRALLSQSAANLGAASSVTAVTGSAAMKSVELPLRAVKCCHCCQLHGHRQPWSCRALLSQSAANLGAASSVTAVTGSAAMKSVELPLRAVKCCHCCQLHGHRQPWSCRALLSQSAANLGAASSVTAVTGSAAMKSVELPLRAVKCCHCCQLHGHRQPWSCRALLSQSAANLGAASSVTAVTGSAAMKSVELPLRAVKCCHCCQLHGHCQPMWTWRWCSSPRCGHGDGAQLLEVGMAMVLSSSSRASTSR